jgi:hypothetical protein
MATPVQTAQVKVEEAIKAVLVAYGALAGWTVLTDQPLDAALEDAQFNALVIRTMAQTFDDSFEYGGALLVNATIDIEAVVSETESVARRAQEGLAHAQAALMADYTLGGRLQDLLPIDVAGGDGQRRDAGAISQQYRAEYLIARGNAFTILGQAGATF